MPLPVPNKNEEKQEFLHRCMSNDTMQREFKNRKQRYAVCLRQWNNKRR